MDFKKTIKFVLLLLAMYLLFPEFSGGIILSVIKFLFYMLLIYIAYVVINDGVNYIFKNWHKAHLLWIDEREHAKGHTLANLSRLDFLGATFRFIHYVKYNWRKILQSMWYEYLQNMIPILSFILIVIIVVVFLWFS